MNVLLTVGTDHHPFDRAIAWLEAWSADHSEVSCFVQSGTSVPPVVCEGQPYLAFADLCRRLAEADVVISHGGPATIMDARAAGHRPIVVPRRPDLGEHVDDHQIRFCRWMNDRRQVVLARDRADLCRLLDQARHHPDRYRLTGGDDGTGKGGDAGDGDGASDGGGPPAGHRAALRFGDLIDGLLA